MKSPHVRVAPEAVAFVTSVCEAAPELTVITMSLTIGSKLNTELEHARISTVKVSVAAVTEENRSKVAVTVIDSGTIVTSNEFVDSSVSSPVDKSKVRYDGKGVEGSTWNV